MSTSSTGENVYQHGCPRHAIPLGYLSSAWWPMFVHTRWCFRSLKLSLFECILSSIVINLRLISRWRVLKCLKVQRRLVRSRRKNWEAVLYAVSVAWRKLTIIKASGPLLREISRFLRKDILWKIHFHLQEEGSVYYWDQTVSNVDNLCAAHHHAAYFILRDSVPIVWESFLHTSLKKWSISSRPINECLYIMQFVWNLL